LRIVHGVTQATGNRFYLLRLADYVRKLLEVQFYRGAQFCSA
jgi:hypothetical protein